MIWLTLVLHTENDYIFGPYDVTILAGDILGLLEIAIINDNIVEETEIFDLVINASSLPERVVAGDPNSTVVNILDSDGKETNIYYAEIIPIILLF